MALTKKQESIVSYLADDSGEMTLSEPLKAMLEKYQLAYSLLMKHKSVNLTSLAMEKLNNWNNVFTAKRDLRIAQEMFGNVNEISKKIHRQIITESIIKTYNLAFAAKDIEAMIKCEKNYIAANGLNKDEVDIPDFDITIPVNPIVIDIEFLKSFSDKLDPKVLEKIAAVFIESKIFKYAPEFAEEIPFIDVTKPE